MVLKKSVGEKTDAKSNATGEQRPRALFSTASLRAEEKEDTTGDRPAIDKVGFWNAGWRHARKEPARRTARGEESRHFFEPRLGPKARRETKGHPRWRTPMLSAPIWSSNRKDPLFQVCHGLMVAYAAASNCSRHGSSYHVHTFTSTACKTQKWL